MIECTLGREESWTTDPDNPQMVIVAGSDPYDYIADMWVEDYALFVAAAPETARQRDELREVCGAALAKAESDLDGEMRLNESHLYAMRAAIANAKEKDNV